MGNNQLAQSSWFAEKINMFSMCTYAAFLLIVVPNVNYAGSIYKCITETGKTIFSDQQCPNSEVEVVHKETEEEIQRRIYREKIETLESLILSNRFAEAEEYAVKHGMSEIYSQGLKNYEKYLKRKAEEEQRIAQERERGRQQQIKETIIWQQQQIAQQNRYIEQQRQELSRKRNILEQQQDQIDNQQHQINANSHPKFVPSTGQWCQQLGGVMNCW